MQFKRTRTSSTALLVCLTFSFLLFPFFFAYADSPTVSTSTSEGRLAVFDDVWQTVNDRYYDPNFHGVDWAAQRTKFRNLAANAQSQAELYLILRRLITSLRDAHTRVFAPEEKFDWQRPKFITVGLSLREIESQLIAVSVERGSDAERAGLRAGDIIEKINGERASAVLDARLRDQPDSSTPQAARLFALSSLFNGPSGSSVTIDWKSADDKKHQTSLARRWFQRTPGLRISNQNDIAIVSIDAFTHQIALEFARITSGRENPLANARGIIIDLRNNGGGDAQAMAEMVSAFLPPATALGQFTDRHGNISLKIDTGGAGLYSARTTKAIRSSIVILSSERTSSAAEIFISALQQANRASVVGAQTCGCVLAVRMHHALPDGGELAVSELDYKTASGSRLEGAGIKPDTAVSITRQDIYAGHDAALESAFNKIRRNAHH
ncbi:MAG TPA: S41 family peptidase [Pyrinomonadaceae bacterium]|nr:S41 family peptidase [Pyrinomonadaceae bacterium]